VARAANAYRDDVLKGAFPDDDHSYHLKPEVAKALKERGEEKR
jgi:hypothetical protein